METVFQTDLFEFKWVRSKSTSSARSNSKVDVRARAKVMVVLHGRGDSLDAFSEIQNELEMPEMNFLLLNAPRKFEDGFSWYRSEPNHAESVVQVRAQLFELVRHLNLAGFSSENIFWMGHSQGCLIACDLVLNHPSRFGGLIGVSGYLWFFRGWKKKLVDSGAYGTPWLITHGTHDRVIRPREIREDIAALVASDVPVLYREFRKGHDFDFTLEVPFIRDWLKTRNLEATTLHS